MGYHQRTKDVNYFDVNVAPLVNGTVEVEPDVVASTIYSVVRLTAEPDEMYRIKLFQVDGQDVINTREPDILTGKSYTKKIVMDDNHSVTVTFEERKFVDFTVIEKSHNGDLLDPSRSGTYTDLYRVGDVAVIKTDPHKGHIPVWSGTDDDSSIDPNNKVTIPDCNEITVEVDFRETKTLLVPGQYPSIQAAVSDAQSGDTITVLNNKTYYEHDIDLQGKSVTIASLHPDNPDIISTTIIDCGGWGRAFLMRNGEDPVIDGFIIRNAQVSYFRQTQAPNDVDGADGVDANGGAIAVYEGSDPTISNCIFVR